MIVTAYNYTIHKNFAKLQGIKNAQYCNQIFNILVTSLTTIYLNLQLM